jgi:hypothetical protein
MIISLVILWLIGLGFIASRVGVAEDFGVLIREHEELHFPTWSIRVWEQDYLSDIQCHHCHWGTSSENCEAQPLLNYVVTYKNALGQPQRVQFNSDMSITGTAAQEDYIHCTFNITGLYSGGTLYVFEGPDQPSGPAAMKPAEDEMSVHLEKGEGVHIAIKKMITRFNNDTEVYSWERTNSGFSPVATDGSTYFDLYYGTYTTLELSQNSKGLDMIDFWQFMGEVGGLAFLFYLIYKLVLYVVTVFFVHSAGVDRSHYQSI